LRSDPRFQRLLVLTGLAQSAELTYTRFVDETSD